MPLTNNHFLSSGIIAISLYLFFLFSILYYMIEPNTIKITSFERQTAIELDLSVMDSPKKVEKTSPQKPKVEDVKIEEKSASKDTVSKTTMKDLFANVKSDAKTIEKKETTTEQSSKVASIYKSTFEKEERKEISSAITKQLENINLNSSSSMAPTVDANVDEYYSLIYDILASKWNPSSNSKGLSSNVLITIYKNGKFSYNIISKSGNRDFDSALESFLSFQTNEKFPEHQKGEKTTLKVTFKTKGD